MNMGTIDLNADLGEGGSQDAALISLASSVNIACGGHAGTESTMRSSIEMALAAGVALGAHPGYEDPEHFGRRPLNLPLGNVRDLVSRQLERLALLVVASKSALHHVKPHGALYLQADRDPELARAVVEGVKRIVPGCGFYAPPGGCLAAAGMEAGLSVRAEGFVDRRYGTDGKLVPRSHNAAVIEDIASGVSQGLEIACRHRVQTLAGTWISLHAETLCVHGDDPQAVFLLRAVRQALEDAGLRILA
jgi:UPF0271 protein